MNSIFLYWVNVEDWTGLKWKLWIFSQMFKSGPSSEYGPTPSLAPENIRKTWKLIILNKFVWEMCPFVVLQKSLKMTCAVFLTVSFKEKCFWYHIFWSGNCFMLDSFRNIGLCITRAKAGMVQKAFECLWEYNIF